MSVKSKQLREERAKLVGKIREFADLVEKEKRALSAEEDATYKQVNTDYDRMTREIEMHERAELVEGHQSAPVGDGEVGRQNAGGKTTRTREQKIKVDEETRALAFQGWCRMQLGHELRKRHIKACQRLGVHPYLTKLRCKLADTECQRKVQSAFRTHRPEHAAERISEQFEKRALSIVSMPAGAALIPNSFVQALEINMLAFGGVLQDAEIIRTNSGEDMAWPTGSDTSNKGRRIAQNAAVATNVEPTFNQIAWHAYKYTSDAVLVPYELLEDSAFDLASVLGAMLGERLGRILADELTMGTGNSMPRGIVTAATTFAAASATAISYDDVLKLIHAVDPSYRTGNVGFQLHDQILLQLRLLKDSNGLPLWESFQSVGQPDRIRGYPFTVNQSMDSTMAAGKKTLLFGQRNRFKVRQVRGVRFYRLQERYRDNDQDGFVAFTRADGNLLEAGTPPVKVLLH